ncbi:MAG: efflux transporter outer membrane subunit [Candidatus Omnitrophica bacterium]|nr:efflux transporter outer membrane subunit [Candidatus Omnitrophota bacterium]
MIRPVNSAGLVCGAIIILMSHGCSIGPDYHRPPVTLMPNWLEASNTKFTAKTTPYYQWWQAFNDPVLNNLIETAYHQNLTIQIAGARVLEARAQLGIASASFFPQPQVNGSVQYDKTSHAGTGSSPGSTYSESQLSLAAGWELDFWGKFKREFQSARSIWLSSLADYDNALVSLTAGVADSYISLRTTEKRLEIAQQNVAIQKASLQIAQARLDHGTVTSLDVAQAQTVLNDTLATIPLLETLLRQEKNSLSLYLGLAPSDLTNILKGPSQIPASPGNVVIGIPADLLRRRPDIRSAEYQAMAQSAQIGIAKSDLFPAFSLNGAFGLLATNSGTSKLNETFQWRNRTVQLGPSFQWNILNFERIKNNMRAQDAKFQQLILAYQNTILNAQKEVEDNLSAYLKDQDRAELLGKSAEAAQMALDLAIRQYREGTKDFTTVIAAHQALLNEQNNLAIALGGIDSDLISLYRAIGGGWEIRNGKPLISAESLKEMTARTDWGKLLAPAEYMIGGSL